MTEATAAAPAGKIGLWEDFVDIFIQPRAVFERRRDGQFGLALFLLVLFSALLFFGLKNGIAPVMDAEMSRQVAAMAEKNQNLTAEQLAGAKSAMEKFAMFGAVIFIPVGIVITGVLIWIVSRFFDAKIAIAAAMMIATYSQVPKLVDTVVTALQGLFLPPESITSRYSVALGPARFLDPDANPVALTLAGGLDLFTIWVFVLIAIGLSVVARVPLRRAGLASAAIWAVTLLPALYSAM